MASSSTSHNGLRTSFQLRLVDGADDSAQDFSLYGGDRVSDDFDLVSEGVVHEAHSYQAVLLCAEPLEASRARIRVNGEQMVEAVVRATGEPIVRDGGKCHCYELACEGENRHLFRMTYGFAIVEIDIGLASGGVLDLATRSIPCACDREDQERAVAEMLAELTSENESAAIRWMLHPSVKDGGGLPFLEGSVIADASKSLRAYLKLCEGVLACYESNMGYFRAHAHSQIMKRDEVVPIRRARRLGRRELQWLARSPEVLYETKAETAVSVDGRHYAVDEIQTERKYRSLNNDENRSLVAFASEVALSLGAIAERSQEQIEWLQGIAEQLGRFDPGAGLLPGLVVVKACLERELPLIERVSVLKVRARWVQNRLFQIMPDVPVGSFKMPRRSKVFQEIRPYSNVYAQMQLWNDFGEFELLRDGLALQTWRMDKLYEYYALYKILESLFRMGYLPDVSSSEPIKQVRYSVRSRFTKNEKQVANVFILARGKERVRVYYEPVIYGDNREEHGITLHRTTKSQLFMKGARDSYWTPDFLVVHHDGQQERRIVLDAKFRTVSRVRGDGSDNDAKTCYGACALKYKGAILDSEGRGIDSLWLLCGRVEEPELLVYQGSSWAQSLSELVPDGIATVAPGADMLEGVLRCIGLGEDKAKDGDDVEIELGCKHEAESLSGSAASQAYAVITDGDISRKRMLAMRDGECGGIAQLGGDRFSVIGADSPKPRTYAPVISMAERQGRRTASPTLGSKSEAKNEKKEQASKADGESTGKERFDEGKLSGKHKAAKAEGELLEKIERLCDATVDKSALFSAASAQKNFGFNHPLLRESLPRGGEAKLYTKERCDINGGKYHVFSSWRPIHISRLDRCLRMSGVDACLR